MPLKFSWQKLPVDENGKSYDSLEAFQVAKLADIIEAVEVPGKISRTLAESITTEIVTNKDVALEILQLNTSARPSARGVPKKRRTKPADAQLPLKENAA